MNGDCSNTSPAEGVTVTDDRHLTFTTPMASGEGWADIKVVNPTKPTICLGRAYKLIPLAFTANQYSGDISIIDTTGQDRFAPMASMTLQPGTLPFGIALSRGAKAGRELYVVDYATGNLQIYDAANFQYLDKIQLQDPGSGVQRIRRH